MSSNEIELKVAEALQLDVGRGIVRLDTHSCDKLNVLPGDIIEVIGKRTTAAKVLHSHSNDEGYGIIRMDGSIRQNAGVSIGDRIFIRKTNAKDCTKLILAPRTPMQFSPNFDRLLKNKLVGRPLMKGDTIHIAIFGNPFPLVVTQIQPSGVGIINVDTNLQIKSEPQKEYNKIPSIAYEDIGGLKDEIQKIREMIELPLRHPEIFQRLGIEPPKGVILHGPPGTGKTLLAKAVASESEANFFYIGGPEFVSKYVGESEERLRKLFREAEESAPSIIFMDEIDAIAPKRSETTGEVEKRMVSQLLTLMDGLETRGHIIVIGATNRQNSIDEALRRPGRFDKEIEIGVPDRNARKEILEIHTRHMPLEDVDIDYIANVTHGFTGADLSSLCKEAAMYALKRMLPEYDLDKPISTDLLEKLFVKHEDFLNSINDIQPSALREVFTEVPNVKWNDIGGLEKPKQLLKEAVELPLKNPEYFETVGIRTTKGILLVGPPGTGKTMLAKAIANESEANFISIKGPEIFNKWIGESEKIVREIFRKARQAAPCIIFIDEIDAVAPERKSEDSGSKVTERIVNTLLNEMDGMINTKRIVVIGATNYPSLIDKALLRSGRFDYIVEIDLPDVKTREEIFKIHTSKMPLNKNIDFNKLAELSEGYSGADIEGLCRETGMILIRENRINDKIEMKDFEKAFTLIKPSVGFEEKKLIEKFKENASLIYR